MNMIKFIIVENEAADYKSTRHDLFLIGASERDIWPSRDSDLMQGWSQVGSTLTRLKGSGWNPEESTVVLILDLALDLNDEDFERGVDAIITGRQFYQDYATVVCTRAAPRIGTRLEKYVDGVFHKVNDADFETRKARFAKVVRGAIRAVEKRKGRPSALAIESFAKVRHDLHYLAFTSTYSEDILLELVESVSQHGPLEAVPSVTVASGGYSGATVLLFEYRTQSGGSRQVAVKISRDRELLEDEAARLKEVHKASHKFDDLPIPLVHGVKVLPGYPDVHYVQTHFVNGRTLESTLINVDSLQSAQVIVHALGAALAELTTSGLADSRLGKVGDSIVVSDRLRLTFAEVVKQVKTGIKLLDGNASFKARFASYVPKIDALEQAVSDWSNYCQLHAGRQVPFYEQHGDLNARNILIQGDQKRNVNIRIIDFARFGSWPAFYDLTRLRLHLALRVLDPGSSMREIFPDRIVMWDKAYWDYERPEGLRKTHAKEFQHFATYVSAAKMLDSIQTTVYPSLAGLETEMCAARRVIMLNEVVRVICYDDVAWTKRIWFSLLAARIFEEIGEA